jgi:3-oxoacyl-[acyl-carrier protein] reductase
LAFHGANLVLHGNQHLSNAEKLADELREFAISVEILAANLADLPSRAAFIEKIQTKNPLDVLVNAAGADVLTGAASQWPFEQKLTTLWQVDVEATICLSRSIGQRMYERGSGSIVNIGWSQAATGMAGQSGQFFGAVKGAIEAFTKSLARSLAPRVRVNCVAPGWIQTKWGDTASDYWQARAPHESLLARWGQPEDVATVARFLASQDAAFVNGQVINVDGGFAGTVHDQHWN